MLFSRGMAANVGVILSDIVDERLLIYNFISLNIILNYIENLNNDQVSSAKQTCRERNAARA